jgi:hypothetical protein
VRFWSQRQPRKAPDWSKVPPADEVLFLTHTPEAYPAGWLWERPDRWGGGAFVITRQIRKAPTALLNGGSVSCWEIRGCPY